MGSESSLPDSASKSLSVRRPEQMVPTRNTSGFVGEWSPFGVADEGVAVVALAAETAGSTARRRQSTAGTRSPELVMRPGTTMGGGGGTNAGWSIGTWMNPGGDGRSGTEMLLLDDRHVVPVQWKHSKQSMSPFSELSLASWLQTASS